MDVEIEDLIRREKIRDVVHSYARAIDFQDWDSVMNCFSADAIIQHGSYDGPVNTFIEFASAVLNQTENTIHSIGGVVIKFEGDIAYTDAPFVSFHSISGRHEKVGPVETGGADTDWIVAGRYRDTLKCFNGEWKIIARKASNDWTRVQASAPSE